MKRRDVLKYTALITGAAISLPLSSSLLSGCQSGETPPIDDYKSIFFNTDEFSVLKNLVDLILPKTDSPSATGVGVHRTIDTMLGKVYKTDAQADYRKGFDALLHYLSPNSKGTEQDLSKFLKMNESKQVEMLQQLNQSDKEELKIVKEAFLNLRQQTIAYYLSTEEIGKNHLTYLPVPGTYEACISLEDAGGKAWAI